MSNQVHGLTEKDENGRTVAHPLYWVWREKRKHYVMAEVWEEVLAFVEWAESNGWKRGDSIRRYRVDKPYSPINCYVHVKGTSLGTSKKGEPKPKKQIHPSGFLV